MLSRKIMSVLTISLVIYFYDYFNKILLIIKVAPLKIADRIHYQYTCFKAWVCYHFKVIPFNSKKHSWSKYSSCCEYFVVKVDFLCEYQVHDMFNFIVRSKNPNQTVCIHLVWYCHVLLIFLQNLVLYEIFFFCTFMCVSKV